MKTLIISIIGLAVTVINMISMKNEWIDLHGNHWTLAERASTIEAKTDKVTKFYQSIQDNKQDFSGSSALFLKNQNNNLENNLVSLKTLVDRLADIQKMNVSSLEYQMAIKQITENEMDQADAMINVIKGSWEMNHYFMTYNFGGLLLIGSILGIIAGFVLIVEPTY
jgi:uncharacterized protein (DUF342 family)